MVTGREDAWATARRSATGSDIWILPLDGDRKPRPLVRTPLPTGTRRFRRTATGSRICRTNPAASEIHVTAFPDGGRKWQVSTDGGFATPAWSRKGSELFYQTTRGVMAAPTSTGAEFSVGRARLLFEGRYEGTLNMPDDQHFLMIKTLAQEASATQVNLVLNWFEDLRRLAAPAR